jgi:hypothetical protein
VIVSAVELIPEHPERPIARPLRGAVAEAGEDGHDVIKAANYAGQEENKRFGGASNKTSNTYFCSLPNSLRRKETILWW